MRAFLVDPRSETIEQVEHSSELADMRATIGCRWIEARRLQREAVLFIDEEARLHGPRLDLFRILSRDPARAWSVVGRGLIFGLEGDHEVDAPFTLKEVQAMVWFPVDAMRERAARGRELGNADD